MSVCVSCGSSEVEGVTNRCNTCAEERLGDYSRNPKYQQFVRDMHDAGHECQHYRGRFFYEGPAVDVDELQDGLGASAVRMTYDNLGLGWIVYPKG